MHTLFNKNIGLYQQVILFYWIIYNPESFKIYKNFFPIVILPKSIVDKYLIKGLIFLIIRDSFSCNVKKKTIFPFSFSNFLANSIALF